MQGSFRVPRMQYSSPRRIRWRYAVASETWQLCRLLGRQGSVALLLLLRSDSCGKAAAESRASEGRRDECCTTLLGVLPWLSAREPQVGTARAPGAANRPRGQKTSGRAM